MVSNKKKLFISFFMLILFFVGFQSLEAQTYFVREGDETNNSIDFQIGEFTSPHLMMYPYLRESGRDFLTLPQIENYLRSYGFSITQINRVRSFLTSGQRTAFLYYLNNNNMFRWIWITFYE
jgi:hypothetical protein